ncbi:Protein kinase-like domain containing protein [Tylopilus felleus]
MDVGDPLHLFSGTGHSVATPVGHAKGVVHGDITPESVDVVDGKGILNQGPPPDRAIPCPCISSNRDVHVRSVRWAAPELFCTDDSNPRPTAMSDVYSFGCLMLQVLTGRVPYCGTKRLEQVVYLKYLGRDPIDAHTPKVADRYATFMRRCWSLEPEKRPTMESVVGFIHNEIQWFASGQNVV